MELMARRVAFSLLSILVGYSIFGIFAFSLRFRLDFPVEAYWFSFVFVSLPLLFEVFFWKSNPKLRLLYLLSFSLMIHLQYAVVDSSSILLSQDAVADYKLSAKIVADSRWAPLEWAEWTFGFEYRFYPVTNFLYATVSLLTGIPLLIVVKYLFVVKVLVVTPIAERLFRGFSNQRVAYLATMLFLASPGATLFPHKESFAVIFFILGMYAITKTEKARQYLLISVLSILTLIMTHHFTTYVFLVLLTSLFLVGHFYKSQKTVKVSGQFFMLCFIVFLTWVAYIAWTIIALHQRFFFGMFFEVLLPGRVMVSELMPLYTLFERILVWLGMGITAVSAVLGLLSYVRNRKIFSPSFFAMTVFLVPLLFLASIFRFSPNPMNILVSHRIFEFGYLIIGIMSALLFIQAFRTRKKLILKAILVCAIVVMMIVGPMTGAMHPRTFAMVSDVISIKGLSMNTWMSESGASNEYAIGDKVLYIILAGYGDSFVTRSSEFFTSQDFDLPSDIRSRSSYVVTYIYMTDFYGPDAARFYASPFFHNLYANGLLSVFRIANHTSS